jgi:hypothetical protein
MAKKNREDAKRTTESATKAVKPRIEYTWEGEGWSWCCRLDDVYVSSHGLFVEALSSSFQAARHQALVSLAGSGLPGTVKAYEHVLVDPEIERMVEECRYVKSQATYAADAYLEARKRTVLALMRRGLPLREMARMMGVSVQRASVWVGSQKKFNGR